MKISATSIPGVLLIEPRIFQDERGEFFETFQAERYREATGVDYVQDNCSRSARGVLRGLHYQVERPQAKLVSVIRGVIYDVVVDLRTNSATYGKWAGFELSEENRHQLFVPVGLAHGFCVISPQADVVYKCSDYYYPAGECSIRWNDEFLKITWPIEFPVLSKKDAAGLTFQESPKF